MKKARWENGSMREDRSSRGLYKAGTTVRALFVPPLGYASFMVSRGSRNLDGAGSWLLGVEGFDVIDMKYRSIHCVRASDRRMLALCSTVSISESSYFVFVTWRLIYDD